VTQQTNFKIGVGGKEMEYDLKGILERIEAVIDCGYEDAALGELLEFDFETIVKIMREIEENEDIPEEVKEVVREDGLTALEIKHKHA
jgi:hypothetical protein